MKHYIPSLSFLIITFVCIFACGLSADAGKAGLAHAFFISGVICGVITLATATMKYLDGPPTTRG